MAASDDEDQEINVDENSRSSGSYYNQNEDDRGSDQQNDASRQGSRGSESEGTDFERSRSPVFYKGPRSPYFHDDVIKADRSRSTSPVETATTGSVLPFSISRLLSEKGGDLKDRVDSFALYQSGLAQLHGSRLPGLLYGAGGVIRVPAHRPGGPGLPPGLPPGLQGGPMHGLGAPFPWLAAMDPAFQRSAAAAAFASQVVKERLTGMFVNFIQKASRYRSIIERYGTKTAALKFCKGGFSGLITQITKLFVFRGFI